MKGIQAGRLEYREGSVWQPLLQGRLLRSQLEQYIAEEVGPDHLANSNTHTEPRKIKVVRLYLCTLRDDP